MNKRLGLAVGVFATIVGLTLMDSIDQAEAGLFRGGCGGYSCGGYSCGGGGCRGGRHHRHHHRRAGCCGQTSSACAPMNGCGAAPSCCGATAPAGSYDGGAAPGMQGPPPAPPAPEASPSDAPPPAPSEEAGAPKAG